MKILATEKFEKELKLILSKMLEQLDCKSVKNFKLYLDTIMLNIPTKLHKYKISPFFDDEKIKEIDYNGFKIFFYEDSLRKNIILLSIA